jgi:quercetin dioxygenase-like cupin family protein
MEMKYFVKAEDVPVYSPKNHIGTHNRRLIGYENGAKNLEIVLGVIEKGLGAMPHAHQKCEQVFYILEGRVRVEILGHKHEIGPGECCFFPAGECHVFTVVSDEPAKLLVIYSPPYNENST